MLIKVFPFFGECVWLYLMVFKGYFWFFAQVLTLRGALGKRKCQGLNAELLHAKHALGL